MESLQIKTGKVGIKILDDFGVERGIFQFNPEDLGAAKKMSELLAKIKTQSSDLEKRESECKTGEERMLLLEEVCSGYRKDIDNIWGIGSSDILFGNAVCTEMFEDFLTGIGKHYSKESAKRVNKYKQRAIQNKK